MTAVDAGTTDSRIVRMKRALTDIIKGATNLNIGLMRFNGSYGGGPILYPVTDIDAEICEGQNCEEIVELNRVGATNNDAEQRLDNRQVSLDGNILSMGEDFDGDPSQMVGLRFSDLNIPQGAVITSARIEFTAERDATGVANLNIRAEATDDSPQLQSADNNLTNRVGGISQSWSPENWIRNLSLIHI